MTLPPGLSTGLRPASDVCAGCILEPPPVDHALASLDYAFPWSELIARFKFGGRPGWAPFFASLMLTSPAIRQALADLQADDIVLPLPLSAQRLQERGFNQAWELARALARQSGTRGRLEPRLLLRVRHTLAQTELLRAERLANVKGAFQIDPLQQPLLAGRRVLLVDDVMTSGASLFTAAQSLREGGAAHVTVMALARTPAA